MRDAASHALPGTLVYVLVTAGPGTEGSLGKTSAGAERQATSYCNR